MKVITTIETSESKKTQLHISDDGYDDVGWIDVWLEEDGKPSSQVLETHISDLMLVLLPFHHKYQQEQGGERSVH